MASRLTRALRRMTDRSAMSWWRPAAYDPIVALPAVVASTRHDAAVPRKDGSSAELRERQRALAFDMYAEALVRLADEDGAGYGREGRATA